MYRRAWTEADLDRIAKLWNDDHSLEQIAMVMGASKGAISGRVFKMQKTGKAKRKLCNRKASRTENESGFLKAPTSGSDPGHVKASTREREPKKEKELLGKSEPYLETASRDQSDPLQMIEPSSWSDPALGIAPTRERELKAKKASFHENEPEAERATKLTSEPGRQTEPTSRIGRKKLNYAPHFKTDHPPGKRSKKFKPTTQTEPNEAIVGGIPFEKLERNQCQWPISGDHVPRGEHRFCGAKRISGAIYCPKHKERAARKGTDPKDGW